MRYLVFLLPCLAFSFDSPFLLNYPSPISNASGVFGNPGGIHVSRGPITTMGLVMEENKRFDNARVSYQGQEFAFGYRYIHHDYNSQFIIGHSFELSENISVGSKFQYDWREGQNGITADWGSQWEPTTFLKLGYYTKNLWHNFDESGRRAHQYASAGLRPLSLLFDSSPFVTLAYNLDFTGFDDKFWSDRRQSLLADLQILGWINLQGQMDLHKQKNYMLGATIQTTPNKLLGYHQSSPQKNNFKSEWVRQTHHKTKKKFFGHPGKVIELNLNKTIIEGRVRHSWFQSSSQIGHLDVIDQINQISLLSGDRVVLLKTGRTACGYALATHIRRSLEKLKSKGVQIVAYMEFTSNLNYYLASVADKIVMPPSSYFDVKGFGTEITFYKGLMEKIGLEAQFIKHGKYKSYPEIFTRDSMSVEWQENLTSTFQSLWKVFLDDISTSRKMNRDTLESFLSQPGITLKGAVDAGVIDTLLYIDQISEYMLGKKVEPLKLAYHGQYKTSWSQSPKIAVIVVEGMIVSGGSTSDGLFTKSNAGSESIARQIKKAKNDPEIKALILRVNSPGGSAVASDIIHRELLQFRQKNKPIIVSIGNTCASGGYYIASAGDVIVAEKNSIVGSIGIFGGKFVAKGLYDKVHVKKQTVKVTPHADAKSIYRKWDDKEVAAIQTYMDEFYDRFINIVEKGRRIPKDSLANLGEGRIFTGFEALNNGLVDRTGDFESAVAIAKFKIGLLESSPVNTVSLSTTTNEWVPDNILNKIYGGSPLEKDLKNFSVLAEDVKVWALSPSAMPFQ